MKLLIKTRIDEYTYYYINSENDIIIDMGPREKCKNNKSDKPIVNYTKDDIKNFYLTHKGPIKYDEKSGYLIHEKNNLVFIPLSNVNGYILDYTFTEFDNFSILSTFSFHRNVDKIGKKYVKSTNKKSMHEIIFGRKASIGYKIDHINSNGLDNRKNFLREISNSANTANRIKKKGTSSKFIGVSKTKSGKWRPSIKSNNKNTTLRSFENELEAARARDMYAVLFYKEAAKLNYLNGKKILKQEEIENIINKGIEAFPEDFKPGDRNLPKNIYDNNGYGYICKVYYDGNTYKDTAKTIDEAIIKLENLNKKINEIKEEKKLKEKIKIDRNSKGTAIIKTFNKEKNINGEFEVDDEDWLIFSKYKWYISHGYATGNVDDIKNKPLHYHIYKNIDKDYQIEAGKSIDHIDRNKKNCKRDNLRILTQSQQVQNREIDRKSKLIYKGIILLHGEFYVNYKKTRKGPFKYLEDAGKEYNNMALKDYDGAMINKIPNIKTTVEDLYHKDNMSIEFINSIETISEMYTIFKINLNWTNIGDVNLKLMKLKDIEKYRNLAKDLYNKNI